MPTAIRRRRLFSDVGIFNPYDSDRWVQPVHAVWFGDPLWVPPANGAGIPEWRNGGTVGGNPVQLIPLNEPVYVSSSPHLNGRPAADFAATKFLDVNIADLAQPLKILIAAKPTSTSARTVLGRGSVSLNTGVSNLSTSWRLNFGTSVDVTAAAGLISRIVRLTVNGASSAYAFNEKIVGTGDFGGSGITRFTIGAGYDGVTPHSPFIGPVGYAGIYLATTTPDDRLIAKAMAMGAHYGIGMG